MSTARRRAAWPCTHRATSWWGRRSARQCYDTASAVVWQWWAPELWRRFTIALRRALARTLGVAESRLGEVASVQYAKVAEYQRRGLVHFHALIRLDGPAAEGIGARSPLDSAGSRGSRPGCGAGCRGSRPRCR